MISSISFPKARRGDSSRLSTNIFDHFGRMYSKGFVCRHLMN